MATQQNVLSLLEDESTFGYNELRLNGDAVVLFEQEPLVKSTVELFCFGDYTYFTQHQQDFMELTPKAVYKLKQLSLMSQALKSNRLQYSDLQATLDFSSKLDLEIFLAEAISSKIIDATLLGQEELVKVKASRGRDVLLDTEAGKEELVQKYGAKTISDLIERLMVFNERINQGHEYILKLSGEKEDEREESPAPTQPKAIKKKVVLQEDVPEIQGDVSAMTVDEEVKKGDKSVDEKPEDTKTGAVKTEEGNEDEHKDDEAKDDDDPPSRKRKID